MKNDNKQQKPNEEKTEQKSVDQKQDQHIKELTETLQRLQADFENYKKRVEKSNQDFKKFVQAEVIAKLLPTLDSFEMALKNTQNK